MTPETKKTATKETSGLNNEFSEQEQSMTNSAMPPAFSLKASNAASNPGNSKETKEKVEKKATIQVDGVPEELVVTLEKWEGIKYESYPDNGHVSGGMGHLLDSKEELEKYPIGTAIPKAVVESWAKKDVGEAWEAAKKQAAMLGVDSQDFKIALGSMCFQNGVAWNTEHVRTWELMMAHRWEDAAVEAEDSEWFLQTPARVFEFQTALRKLEVGTHDSHLAEAFTRKVAEGKDLAAKKQSRGKPQEAGNSKSATTAMPVGKEGIKQVQVKLKELGLYDGKVDGIATSSKGESNTTKGIKKFQESRNLPVTGEVDAKTWEALSGMEDKRSIFEKFVKGLERSQKEKSSTPKQESGWGSNPKSETKKPTPDKGWGSEPKGKAIAAPTSNTFVDKKYFVSQSPDATGSMRASDPGWSNCRQAATDILIRYLQGEKPEMVEELDIDIIKDLVFSEGHLRLLGEDKGHKAEIPSGEEAKNFKNDEWLLPHSQQQMAIEYIDEKMSAGIPVVVGVDHTYNRLLSIKAASPIANGYNEGTTDHFVTLVGAGKDEQGRKFYTYFEVGTAQAAGYSAENKLVETSPGMFTRKEAGAYKNQEYHISTVLIYKGDRSRFATEIGENQN